MSTLLFNKYKVISKKGEGTFSQVVKAQYGGKYVAIKCMKSEFESIEQVNRLREIQALRRLSPHQHVVKLLEVLFDKTTGKLGLVFELMEMNVYELIRGRRQYLPEDKVKNYMYQLVKGMDHMHRNGIFHRDIKPENILLVSDTLKLADFGSCRGIYSKPPFTEYISTRWYRAPECLLTDGYYNYKMDMWGVGCVFFEIVSLFPLFPGADEIDQIEKIHAIIGTPDQDLLNKMKKHGSPNINFNFPTTSGSGFAKLIPHASPECIDLLGKLLVYNPDDRITARQALRHPYFKELREAERRAEKQQLQQSVMIGSGPGNNGSNTSASAPSDLSHHFLENNKSSPPMPLPIPLHGRSGLPTISTKKQQTIIGAHNSSDDSQTHSSMLSLPTVTTLNAGQYDHSPVAVHNTTKRRRQPISNSLSKLAVVSGSNAANNSIHGIGIGGYHYNQKGTTRKLNAISITTNNNQSDDSGNPLMYSMKATKEGKVASTVAHYNQMTTQNFQIHGGQLQPIKAV